MAIASTQEHTIPVKTARELQPGESLYWSERPPYNGAWVAVRRMKDALGRKLPDKRKSSKDIKVVAAWLKEQRAEDHRGLGAPAERSLEDWYEFLLLKEWPNRLKPITIQNKKQRWGLHIKPYLGHLPLGRIDKLIVRTWLVELENKRDEKGNRTVGQATVVEVRRDLHAMFEDAVHTYEVLDRNPAHKIKTKEPGPRTKTTVTPVEVRKALKEAERLVQAGELEPWILGMAAVSFLAGLRRGEAQALAHSAIDRQRMVIKVTKAVQRVSNGKQIIGLPKNDKTREVPMTTELLRLIDLTADKRDGLLWPAQEIRIKRNRREGQQPKPGNKVTIHFGRLRDLTKLPKTMIYRDTRSTFSSWLNELALGPKTIIDIMGHSTIQVTADKYIDVTDQAMIAARDRIQELVSGTSGKPAKLVDKQVSESASGEKRLETKEGS